MTDKESIILTYIYDLLLESPDGIEAYNHEVISIIDSGVHSYTINGIETCLGMNLEPGEQDALAKDNLNRRYLATYQDFFGNHEGYKRLENFDKTWFFKDTNHNQQLRHILRTMKRY